MSDANINYTKEVFLHPWNLTFLTVALVTAVGVAGVLGIEFWLPLLFAFAGELLILGTVPHHRRVRRLIRARKRAERRKPPSQKEIFGELSSRGQRRYARLRKLCDAIEENYQGLSYASQGLLEGHLRKLDDLLDSYLNLLYQRERYRDFMDSSTELEIKKSIESIEKEMDNYSERVQEVKERRLRVLKQRLARFEKAHENIEIIGAQLGTIEDTVKYIHEQSWTLQNPEEISVQLDTLIDEVEETQESVQEIEDVFHSSSDLLDDIDVSLDEEELSEPSVRRSRTQN